MLKLAVAFALMSSSQSSALAPSAADASSVVRDLLEQQFLYARGCVRSRMLRVTFAAELEEEVQSQQILNGFGKAAPTAEEVRRERVERYSDWFLASGADVPLDATEGAALAVAVADLLAEPQQVQLLDELSSGIVPQGLKIVDHPADCSMMALTSPVIRNELAFVSVGIGCAPLGWEDEPSDAVVCREQKLFALRRTGEAWNVLAQRRWGR